MASATPSSAGELGRPHWLPRSAFPFQIRFGPQERPLRLAGPVRTDLPGATVAGLADGRHFPFSDDPDAYGAAISAWWAEKVATAVGTSSIPQGEIR